MKLGSTRPLHRFLNGLFFLVVGGALSICLVQAMQVPILGMIIALAALPVFLAFPEFGRTGGDVEFGFAWLIIKSSDAHLIFILYFTVICAVLLQLLWSRVRRARQRKREQKETRASDNQPKSE